MNPGLTVAKIHILQRRQDSPLAAIAISLQRIGENGQSDRKHHQIKRYSRSIMAAIGTHFRKKKCRQVLYPVIAKQRDDTKIAQGQGHCKCESGKQRATKCREIDQPEAGSSPQREVRRTGDHAA